MAFATGTTSYTNDAPKKSWFSPGLIIGIAALLLVGFLGIFAFSNFLTYQRVGVTSENEIEAMYKSNQNNLGQLTLKVKEALGVAKVNNAELDKILKDAVQARYGDDGAKQAMLWVKENYPGQYDPKLFVNVQQAILSGRTDFEVKQNLLIDRVRVYKNQTEIFWPSLWLKLAGFPRAGWDWKKYDPVVSQQAKQAFETHIDQGMEIK